MVVRRILKETQESIAKDQRGKKRLLKIKFNSEFKNPTDDLKNRIETSEK